jgi:serine/threonine protein kinase/formylglycine-generating enzyme required for sulfatase activity
MASLFLSYRRADSPDTVKLIHERLKKRLPRWEIFYDHENIPLGEQFPDRLRAKVTSATAVLVIIGPKWLEILRDRRAAPIDHVRVEVQLALEAGASVVPVLVGHAAMLTDIDLADFADLQPLLKRNGRPVRPDPDFDADLEPIFTHLKSLDSAEAVGTILDDKYTLTAEIGVGGMGVVYLAQQKQPVQRTVAVKLIKPGMDSRDVLARFDAERQALAVMDHPNIAKELDAGMAASGRPFFVMEHVKGVPITQYCDDKKLTPQERLNLFIPVCNAVQHAHQKGIIHRDLKPSNVLVEVVDGKPVPKVIDFGLAKALGQKLTDKTLYTALDTRVGTLEYSAPEQAAGRTFDVDTRSDIYSLGVLLYELLTGATPFTHADLLRVGEEEMRRVIREDEPTKPSKKLSSSGELPAIAANRHLEPSKLTRMVQGDLDWIVMKCLEKENSRRYETANQLGQEIQRFLADEPVQAGPPSASYRAKKFLRRNRGAVMAATLVLLALVAGIIGTSIGLIAATTAQQQRALAQVNALRDSAPGGVPGILADLEANRATVLPLLRARFTEERDRAKQMRLALALLPVEPEKVRDELVAWMLQTKDPAETLLVRDALLPHSADLIRDLWQKAQDPTRPRAERFRALVVLASWDPGGPLWKEVSPGLAEALLTANALHLGTWVQALHPVRLPLLSALGEVFRGERLPEYRQVAAAVLADYAADQPKVLADLVMDAEEKQFSIIFANLKDQGEQGLLFLTGEIDKKLPPDLPSSDERREKLAKRQANAAVALLRMNQPQKIWPLLKHSPDPRARSYLVHRFGPLGADAGVIIKRLEEEPDVTVQRVLILSLGEFGEKAWTAEDRNLVTKKLKDIYRTAVDPGLHAASEWLLREWNQGDWLRNVNDEWKNDEEKREKKIEEIRQELAKEKKKSLPQWYVAGQGQTMVIIPEPMEPFKMGSPTSETDRGADEVQHKKSISRTFTVAAKSVTVGQYRRFDEDYKVPDKYTRTAELPVVRIDWHNAAAYCNWLSKQEGILEDQWCYEQIKGQVTSSKKNYLTLTGYRLPTEAEMEYATRAGAVTSRYYGESEELLPKYAWYLKNSKEQTWPVGSLKPNDLGFFDMQGNAYTWCQEGYDGYPAGKGEIVTEDKEQRVGLVATHGVLRGGSFSSLPPYVRSADRIKLVPASKYNYIGFRVARTFSISSVTLFPPCLSP